MGGVASQLQQVIYMHIFTYMLYVNMSLCIHMRKLIYSNDISTSMYAPI